MWLTPRERITLALLGAIALIGLGVQFWQQQRSPIRVEPGPTPPSFDQAQDDPEQRRRIEGPPYARWDELVWQARQININQATAEELERLSEIGPSTAQRIVDYRNTHGFFHSPEELLDVPGIGPKTLETVRDYVTVD